MNPGNPLSGPHLFAYVDELAHEVPTDAERQRTFLPRADFPGECIGRHRRASARIDYQHRLRGFHRLGVAIAAGQQAGNHQQRIRYCGRPVADSCHPCSVARRPIIELDGMV